jgi:hypothetical protein
LHSNDVLKELAPGLRGLGYAIESSRSEAHRIRRPVLFGRNGRAEVAYDIDAFHDGHGIVVEVEAGRAASNNATYRNIIRASLILDAQYLVLLLPVTYRFNNRGQPASVPVFTRALDLLSALYASQHLPLPLCGVLLVGLLTLVRDGELEPGVPVILRAARPLTTASGGNSALR